MSVSIRGLRGASGIREAAEREFAAAEAGGCDTSDSDGPFDQSHPETIADANSPTGRLDLYYLTDFVDAVGREAEEVGGVLGVLAEEDEEVLAPHRHSFFG